MNDPRRPPPGDIVAGFVLALVAVGGIIHSLNLETPAGWHTAPGLFPLSLSTLLLAMALTLIGSGVRAGGLGKLLQRMSNNLFSGVAAWFGSHRRTLAAMTMVAAFYFGLLAFLWFEVASTAFLFAMACFFWAGSTLGQRLALAAVTPFVFVLAFQVGFDLGLPGNGTLTELILFKLR